jgi:hypothetical protein
MQWREEGVLRAQNHPQQSFKVVFDSLYWELQGTYLLTPEAILVNLKMH